MLTESQVI